MHSIEVCQHFWRVGLGGQPVAFEKVSEELLSFKAEPAGPNSTIVIKYSGSYDRFLIAVRNPMY